MGYRHKSILLPARDDDSLVLGGFARGTHDVVDLPECTVVAPSIRSAADALREALEPAFLRGALAARPPGSLAARPPGLRALVLRATRTEGVLATFVVTDRRAMKVLRPLAARLVKAGAIAGAWLQEHDGRGDAVVSRRRPRLLAGARAVTEHIGGLSFPLGPLSFFQVHPSMLEAMLPEVRRALVGCRSVVDAYCGVGVLGLTCAPPDASLVGIEVNDEAVEIASRVARSENREARFLVGAPASRNDLPTSCDGLIVDPPRSGCRADDLDTLLVAKPKTVVHVACSTGALARDAERLFDRGFRAERLVPAEMLPQTPHLEWIATFRRI